MFSYARLGQRHFSKLQTVCHFSQTKTPKVVGTSNLGKGVDLLFDGDKRKISITSLHDDSFILNDTIVRQSAIVFRAGYLLWDVKTIEEVTIESLSVLTLLYPTVEVLFLGVGPRLAKRLNPDLVKHFHSRGIVIEASSTFSAASTFNVLNGEGRNVAAALILDNPPEETFLLE